MYEKVIVEFPEKNRSSVLRLLKDAQKIYEIKVYTENAKVLRFPGIEISLSERKVIVSGKKVPMTAKEFDVLFYLAYSCGQVFTKGQLYTAIWKEQPLDIDNAVMCLVSELRHKLSAYSKIKYIHTIRGVGYKFDVSGK